MNVDILINVVNNMSTQPRVDGVPAPFDGTRSGGGGWGVGGWGGGGGGGGGGVLVGGGGDWGRGEVGVGGRGVSAAQNGAGTLDHRGGATHYEQIMQELDPLMKASTLIIDDRVIRYVGYWLKMCIDCSAVVIENCVRRPARAGGLY